MFQTASFVPRNRAIIGFCDKPEVSKTGMHALRYGVIGIRRIGDATQWPFTPDNASFKIGGDIPPLCTYTSLLFAGTNKSSIRVRSRI